MASKSVHCHRSLTGRREHGVRQVTPGFNYNASRVMSPVSHAAPVTGVTSFVAHLYDISSVTFTICLPVSVRSIPFSMRELH